MSIEPLPVLEYEPMTAEGIDNARICASSFHHRHKVVDALEGKRKKLAQLEAIIATEEERLPRLRSNRAILEQDIRTLVSILTEIEE